MLQRGSGSIINVVSISSHVVNRPQLHGHYNAAKAGAYQLTRVCAAEWAGRGVRVNSISPGHTLTPMTAHAEDDMKNAWLANTPMGRLGVPADYQGAVVFSRFRRLCLRDRPRLGRRWRIFALVS